MEKEQRLLNEYIQSKGRQDIACRLSRIGKVNAALAADALIRDYSPEMVLSIGCAGSFVKGVSEGDVILAERTAYHDVWCGEGNEMGQVDGFPKFFHCDATLLEKACKALPEARRGLIISGDQFFISEQEDERQKDLYPEALAVDMESTAVAQVCHLYHIPFLAVKIISDTHLDGKQAEHYEGFWQDMAVESFKVLEKILEVL